MVQPFAVRQLYIHTTVPKRQVEWNELIGWMRVNAVLVLVYRCFFGVVLLLLGPGRGFVLLGFLMMGVNKGCWCTNVIPCFFINLLSMHQMNM